MKKTGKIALAMVAVLTLVNCGTDVTHQNTSSPLSGRMPHRDFRWSQYAPTALRDTSSHSLQTPLLGGAGVGSTHYSPIKEDFTALAKKYNFAELEKEYKSFSTKALADTYVKKMFNKFLIVTPNSVQVIRQVEFSRYLKNNGDTSYETSLKNIFTDTPVLYSSLTGMPAVQSKMTSESGTFGFYILGVSPNQTVSTALPATNITETSFTANWSTVTGATSYILIVDGVEIPGITGTNHTLNSLTAGSNHKYRVKAITSGVAGAASNEVSVNTVLTAPITSSATGITQTSLTANWSAVSGATSYTLVFNGTETTGITGTSHTVNSLTPGTSYSYYLKAVNANTESVNSSTINTVTVPSNPTANTASSVTSISFTANWAAVTGVTNYLLTINGTETDVGNVTSYPKTGLPSNTSYTYSVRAKNTSGISPASNTIALKTSPTLTDGLVVNLPFDGNANDISGYNHNGTLYGNPLMVNNAYKFTGTNYIGVGAIPEIPAESDFSVSFWMKSDAMENYRNPFDANFNGAICNYGPRFEQNPNNILAEIGTSSTNFTYISAPDKIDTSNWHHIAAVRSGSTFKYYINSEEIGTLNASSLWTPTLGFGNVVIGKGCYDGPERYFKGLIDNVRIYNRGVSASEINTIYSQTRPPAYVPVDGLAAYYPFNGNANDLSGNNLNGTNNVAVLTTDRLGNSNKAYSFNGTSSFIDSPFNFNGALSDFSFSYWMKFTTLSGGQKMLHLQEGQSGSGGYEINNDNINNFNFYLTSNDGSGLTNYTNPAFVSGNWYHIVSSFNKTSQAKKIYVNGNLVVNSVSLSTITRLPNSSLRIGARLSNAEYFNGSIDEFRVYNKELTQNEVTQLYYYND